MPLGVLKAGVIDFEPPLPAAKNDAIESVGFNCVNKFLFTWDATFWDDTDFIAYTASQRDLFNYSVNVNSLQPGSNALMTFAFADAARSTEAMSDAELTDLVMAHLSDAYGVDLPRPVAVLRSAWSTDPFTLGSYSFTSTSTRMDHFDDLATPVGLVHFAGEHTSREYFSTVHGAYLSGLRVAGEIGEA